MTADYAARHKDDNQAYEVLARAALGQLVTVARDHDLDSQLLVRRTLTHLQRHLTHARQVQRDREALGV